MNDGVRDAYNCGMWSNDNDETLIIFSWTIYSCSMTGFTQPCILSSSNHFHSNKNAQIPTCVQRNKQKQNYLRLQSWFTFGIIKLEKDSMMSSITAIPLPRFFLSTSTHQFSIWLFRNPKSQPWT